MRYFIRHYALRLGMGESAPWVVEDELVKKFNLPSKFSDFLLDPHKVLHTHTVSFMSLIGTVQTFQFCLNYSFNSNVLFVK